MHKALHSFKQRFLVSAKSTPGASTKNATVLFMILNLFKRNITSIQLSVEYR